MPTTRGWERNSQVPHCRGHMAAGAASRSPQFRRPVQNRCLWSLQREGPAIHATGIFSARALLLALAVVVVGVISRIAYRSLPATFNPAPPAAVEAVDDHGNHLRALTPQEEAHAVALWPIHSEVKRAAIRMTFAGITYKTDEHDPAALRATVEPLAIVLDQAKREAQKLAVPEAMAALHAQCLAAIELYESAATEMLTGIGEGSDARLLTAQGLSFQASEETLRVGDQLWPAEHKPH